MNSTSPAVPFNATNGSDYAIIGKTGSVGSIEAIDNWQMSGSGLTAGGPTSGTYNIESTELENVANGTFTGSILMLQALSIVASMSMFCSWRQFKFCLVSMATSTVLQKNATGNGTQRKQ